MQRKAIIPQQDPASFARRRKELLKKIGPDSIVILEGADRVIRNRDVHFPFRQDSSFYYLTGIAEPKVCAILIPDAKEDRYILFSEPKNYDIY